jgi:hypothetical protein
MSTEDNVIPFPAKAREAKCLPVDSFEYYLQHLKHELERPELYPNLSNVLASEPPTKT